MVALTLRNVKGVPLTNQEVDDNFTALNNGKAAVGANTDITSLGGITGGISTADFLDLDQSANAAPAAGRIRWNAARGVPTFGLVGGNVEMELGEGIQLCHNGEGTALQSGQVVYLYGAHGDLPSVKLASNAGEASSTKTFGVVTEDIAINGTGFVTTFGIVNGINTSAIAAGTAIWLGATAGTYTVTKPVAPAHMVFVGIVTRQNPGNGAIFVNPQNGYELDELHDVLIVAKADKDILMYDATAGVWKNYAPAAARANLSVPSVQEMQDYSVAMAIALG